jgi:peptide/nickel transport system substrate-binding protein
MPKRLFALMAVSVLLATACAGGDDEETGGQAPTTQAEQPVRGGTLVVAINADPGHLNPAITSNGGVHTASELMFNGLVGFDEDGRPTPELAERWAVEEGGRVYRFTLREGVRFHDGELLDSSDVKFTFDNALLPLHARTRTSMTAAGVQVEAPDPRTVVFRFDRPYAPLLQQLNVTEAPIIPQHVYEPCGDLANAAACPANRQPVGTGPFKFVSYSVTEIRLERHEQYFRPGLPYLDGVTIRIIPDEGTQVTSLQAGEIDWLWTVRGPDLAVLRGDSGITLEQVARGPGGGNCVLTYVFNLRPPEGRPAFFADLRTRQAIAAGTNRQQAADQILFGQGQVAPAPIHSDIEWASATGLTLPGFDLARARQLLDQAGWRSEGGGIRRAQGVEGVPDGTEFRIDFLHFAGVQGDYGQALRQQFRELGIELETKQMDNPTLTANMFTNRTFDSGIVSYCNESDPEIGVRRQYHSSQISRTPFTNGAGYSNPQMDSLWDQAGSEIERSRRTPIYREIQELAVRDLPYWWLAETTNTRAHRAACTGFNYQNTGLFAEAAYCRR